MELKPTLFNVLFAAWMGRINNRHPIMLRDIVDGGHQRHKILFVINILLTMCGKEDIFPLLQPQGLQNIASFNAIHMISQHFPHRRTSYENRLSVNPFRQKIAPGMLCIWEVNIRNMIHNLSIDHFTDVPIPAAVSSLHMENRDFQPFCGDRRQSRIRITQQQYGIRLFLLQYFIGFGDNIPHGFA